MAYFRRRRSCSGKKIVETSSLLLFIMTLLLSWRCFAFTVRGSTNVNHYLKYGIRFRSFTISKMVASEETLASADRSSRVQMKLPDTGSHIVLWR